MESSHCRDNVLAWAKVNKVISISVTQTSAIPAVISEEPFTFELAAPAKTPESYADNHGALQSTMTLQIARQLLDKFDCLLNAVSGTEAHPLA